MTGTGDEAYDIPIRCLAITRFTPLASIEAMQTDICHALRCSGVLVQEHMHSDYPNFELFRHQLALHGRHEGPRFVFDTNLNHNYDHHGQSIYDAWTLPRFSFLTDSPARKLDKLGAFPNIGMIGVVDADFIELLSILKAPGKGAIPFQHAGPPPRKRMRPTAERPIDVMIVGNVSSKLSTAEWLDSADKGDPVLRHVLESCFEDCRTSDKSQWSALLAHAQERGYGISTPSTLCDLLQSLETHVIANRRRDILSCLGGYRTVFIGGGEATADLAVDPEIDVRGSLAYLDVLDLMEQTKIVIDVSPSFRNGAHERVFYALSRGAYVLTEPSRFLTHEVESDLGISFLPYDSAGVGNAVRAILDRGPAELDAVRQRAVAHYADTHTWSQRVATLMPAIQKLYWPSAAIAA